MRLQPLVPFMQWFLVAATVFVAAKACQEIRKLLS